MAIASTYGKGRDKMVPLGNAKDLIGAINEKYTADDLQARKAVFAFAFIETLDQMITL